MPKVYDFKLIADYAEKCHNDANCSYDNQPYMVHIHLVRDVVIKHGHIFNNHYDRDTTIAAAFLHDCIEDAKQTYNNILDIAGFDCADVVLAVTDVPAENRLMRHLLTMPKTVKDYRAIILKMCDNLANASYSKSTGSSMHKKYIKEYEYRRPIFKMALKWYSNELNFDELEILWNELDEVHNYKI